MSIDTPSPSLLRRFVRFLWGYDFFVSYQWSSGGTYAVGLAERLRDRGYDCFLDRAEFAAGDDWRSEAQHALRHTSRLVVIATRKAVEESLPVRHELDIFTSRSDRVIPVVFGERFTDKERRDLPTLKLIPSTTVDVIEERSRLETGPSVQALDELIQAHRLLKRRTLRSGIALTALVVLAVAAAVATAFWRTAEAAREEEQRQRVVAQEAFVDSQHSLALNFIERGVTAIRDTGDGTGMRFLERAYEIAERVGLPFAEPIPPDNALSLAARRLMAGRAATVGLPLVHGEQVAAVTLGPDGRVVRTMTLNYDGEPSSYQFWDAVSGSLRNAGLSVDDYYFDVSMTPDWTSALQWRGDGFRHLDVASGIVRTVTSEALRAREEDYRADYSARAARLATVASDRTIVLWNAETGEIDHEIDVGFTDLREPEFSADGSAVLATNRDSSFFALIDVETGRTRGPTIRPDRPIRGIHLSPDGRSLVVVDGLGSAQLWHQVEGAMAPLWSQALGSAPLVEFGPAGNLVLAAGGDAAYLILADSGRERDAPIGAGGAITLATFSPDGSLLATVTAAESRGVGRAPDLVHLWDTTTGVEHRLLRIAAMVSSVEAPRDADRGRVTDAVFSPDTGSIAIATTSAVALFDVASGTRRGGPWPRAAGASALSFAEGGSALRWLESESRLVRVFEITIPSRAVALPQYVSGAHLSADGTLLLAVDRDALQLWDVATGEPIGSPAQLPPSAFSVELGPEGRIVAEGDDGALHSWTASADGITAHSDTPPPEGGTLTVTPGGEAVFNGRESRYLWSASSGWVEISAPDELWEIDLIARSPDDALLAAAAWGDGTLQIWDRRSGTPLHALDARSGALEEIEEPEGLARVLFNSDGTRVLTASTYGALLLWDLETGQVAQDFRLPGDSAGPSADMRSSAALSPDGSLLATGRGEVIRLWDVPTGHLVTELRGHDQLAKIEGLAFVDDHILLSAARDGVYRWPIPELRDDIELVREWVDRRAESENAVTRRRGPF